MITIEAQTNQCYYGIIKNLINEKFDHVSLSRKKYCDTCNKILEEIRKCATCTRYQTRLPFSVSILQFYSISSFLLCLKFKKKKIWCSPTSNVNQTSTNVHLSWSIDDVHKLLVYFSNYKILYIFIFKQKILLIWRCVIPHK